ncbi:helix-turn-helix domain-containing protein [Miltoncostaea marina]|uniref:helix-turn-helix domain-containing protein n=1 Tax=Miltoncostaea marina TaxID=2843215 RepID=UPI001C3D5D20|nr:helix-turn-helix domain-containing protein [Miltoncostaea marina]
MPASPDLLLHPVRLRVVQALAGGRRLSAAELAGELADVPQASLYRHIRALAGAGVLAVAEERPARGTAQRVYALVEGPASIGPDDLAGARPEDHLRWFATVVAGLLDDFGRYLRAGGGDLAADGVGYRQVALELSDAELAELAGRMGAALAPVLGNRPAPGRRRRMLTTIVMPGGPPAPAAGGG